MNFILIILVEQLNVGSLIKNYRKADGININKLSDSFSEILLHELMLMVIPLRLLMRFISDLRF